MSKEQEQEPVAWMFPSDLKRFETQETTAVIYSVEIGSQTENSIPLYKESPKREPLSEAEINDLDNEVFGYISKEMFRAVVRLIRKVEKAHGIRIK